MRAQACHCRSPPRLRRSNACLMPAIRLPGRSCGILCSDFAAGLAQASAGLGAALGWRVARRRRKDLRSEHGCGYTMRCITVWRQEAGMTEGPLFR